MGNFLITLILLLNIATAQRVVGYYPHWVADNLPANGIDFDIVTHVLHSFAWPNENGSISSYDGMFGTGISDIVHNQGSKFMLSLGGWGNHVGFEVISANEELRELFIYNLTSILLINGYDGVDLDWEFPDSQSDKENLNLLVAEMDSVFNSINPNWLISMAIPVSNWWGQWHDFEFLVNHIDFFNAMTYGTHGNWSSHSGHLAPLYPSPPGDLDGSCHSNMSYLIDSRGIPKNKINMGLPFWGIKWESSNINEPFTGNTIDIMYYDIPELINNGWSYYWDNDALCPYLLKDDGTKIITYENRQSIGLKCQYALEKELGGMMIWALSYDKTESGQELIDSIEENYLSTFLKKESIIPKNILLSSYPNPFNPVTTIKYDLYEDSFVKITIYDVLGNEINHLVNQKVSSGTKTIKWDATNNEGDKIPSGVYIYMIETETHKKTKKMMLLK